MTTPAFAKTALERLRVLAIRGSTTQELADTQANVADVARCIDDMEQTITQLRRDVSELRADLAPLAIIPAGIGDAGCWCSLCKTWLPDHREGCVLHEGSVTR